jgi:apolipoprotein N-acyltransferase
MFYKILNSKKIIIFIIPFLLGVISILSFQPFNLTFFNFFSIPCLFLIITFVIKKSKSKYRKKPYFKNIFFIGYMFGVGFFLAGNYWISHSLTFDESFKHLIIFSLVLIPLFLGIFFGLSTLILAPFLKNNITSVLIFCSSFAFMDYARSKILTGFPWNLWAYSWSWFPETLQILNVIGLFAFNLFILTVFCSTLLIVFKKNKVNYFFFFSIIFLFFANYLYGSLVINKNIDALNLNSKNKFMHVKIISPSFDLKYNLTDQEIRDLMQKLVKYSEVDKNKKTIFIWPEGVFTGYTFSEIKKYKEIIKSNFSENHKIVFGVNTKQEDNLYNSFVVINNKFEIIYRYNKKKLVPFGEFLPIETYLSKIGLKKITEGFGSFSKGGKQPNLFINDFEILPLICYEIIFPELLQKSSKGINLIVNISEDAWFGETIGPYQHLAKSIFRAVEGNVYLARSANKGVSVFINNNGKIIKRLEPNETGNIELNIPLISNDFKNKNDLIFFVLLFTYVLIFFTLRNKLYD